MSKVFGQPLLDDMAQSQSLPMPLVKQAAREILEVIREGLIRDKVVKVSNFGTFRLKPVAARRGINPQTGEGITIPARHRVIFTPCKALRELIQPVHQPPVPIEPTQAHDETTEAATLTAKSDVSQTEKTEVERVHHSDESPSSHAQTDISPTSTPPQPPPSPETKEQPAPAVAAAERAVDIENTSQTGHKTEKEPRQIEPPLSKQPEATSEPALMQAEKRQSESPPPHPDAETQSRAHSEQPPVSTAVEPPPEDKAANNRKTRILSAAVIAVIALIGVGLLIDEEPASPAVIAHNKESAVPAADISKADVTAAQPPADPNKQAAPADAKVRTDETVQTAAPPQLSSVAPIEETADNSGSAATSNNKSTESDIVSGTPLSSPAQPSDGFFSARSHTVTNGESLWRLARHHYHDPLLWPHIYQANTDSIDNPDYLLVGRTITIPGLQGGPGELTRADRRNIAEGYYLAYLYYKETGREDALFALLEAKRYDKTVVEERRGQINLTRTEEIKLAQQVPMPF